MTIGMWDEAYRTSMDDCNQDRCPINKFAGQCHLRRGHVGACDPHGRSHWESNLEAAPVPDSDWVWVTIRIPPGSRFHEALPDLFTGLGFVFDAGRIGLVHTDGTFIEYAPGPAPSE